MLIFNIYFKYLKHIYLNTYMDAYDVRVCVGAAGGQKKV